ncbi:MAG: phytanoyl-CoA dioxygenase family protein [Actinomycetota bacterium]|nr:phytanoyl-CoA dioxygenase family protein [Actinomycetota bacterium]
MEQGVLVYDAGRVRATTDDDSRRTLQAELARALSDGPGIVVFAGAFEDDVVDAVTATFERIIAAEKAGGIGGGDHFAEPGANDRVWNALQKLAVADPGAFVDYYTNDIVALASTAWLGPGYQLTSQVNVVNPGGKGQTVHRDYHLGFQSPKVSQEFPARVHALSPALTLQGAVAHCDMPVESGPTLYLPHSQKYSHGYLAYWLPEFQDYFLAHHVQLPLSKGDAVFFNPALLHAAGSNHTPDVRRMANLLQVSSAFGRAMETVDRQLVVEAVYPVLLARTGAGLSAEQVTALVAATAEGYAFPTNLDRDPPLNGRSPLTQADLVRRALGESATPAELHERLDALAVRRLTR